MRLTREQRAELFAGNAPRIAGEGECPWKVGDVYRASAKLTLTVVEVRPVKPRWRDGKWTKPGWSLRYEVMDRRDPVLVIRRNPHPQDFAAMRRDRDEHGFPLAPPDPDTLRDAGIESGYTSRLSSKTALTDAGEKLSEATLKQFSDEARDRLRRERQGEYDRKMAKARASALREVELRARQRGVDVSGELAEIDSRIRAMRERAEGDKAA